MTRLMFAIATPALFAAALIVGAIPAAADTTNNLVNAGNNNAGFSIGTAGGSVAAGGTRVSVNGIGTLTGTTTVVGPGIDASITQKYGANGLETTGHFNDFTGSGEIEVYKGVPHVGGTFNGRTVVCDPICHEES